MKHFKLLVFAVATLSILCESLYAQLPRPRNLSGEWICDSTRLAWEAPVGSQPIGYNLYTRGSEHDPWILLRGNLPHTVNYVVYPEILNVCFGLTAFYEQGESLPELVCTFTPNDIPMITPQELNIMAVDRSVEFSWDAGQFGCGIPVGYSVYRNFNSGDYQQIQAYGPDVFAHLDDDLANGLWCYKVQIMSETEELISEEICRFIQTTGIEEYNKTQSFALAQNYPNPFNPSTAINLRLAAPSLVSLNIYDASGRMVKQLIKNQHFAANQHTVNWDGTNEAGDQVTSGVYLYTLTAYSSQTNTPSFTETRQMILAK